MKILVRKLDDGENPIHFASDKDVLLARLLTHLGSEGFRVEGPLTLKGSLHKHHPNYYLKAELTFKVELTCDRCAESFSFRGEHGFDLVLLHIGELTKHPPEAKDAASVIEFQRFELDLVPLAREQFVLALPFQSLCSEKCLGICQKCGQNLNMGRCSCKQETTERHFGMLRNFKITPGPAE